MTERLYQQDMTMQSFTAEVLDVWGNSVLLDRTAFFPRGGGVDCDLGFLSTPDGRFIVEGTVEDDGQILHIVSEDGIEEGMPVEGVIHWPRRHLLMRYHTAMHVLTGVMFQDCGARVTGNQITEEKARVDFNFPEFDRALLDQGFARANEIIALDLPVKASLLSAEDAKQRPELFKLESQFPHELDQIRLIEIEGFDVQADGGCHVARLSEIGKIVPGKAENKGKSNRRVYFTIE
jgi:misacylated tRNA(Ala) deacylase